MRLAPVFRPGVPQDRFTSRPAGFEPASKKQQLLEYFSKSPFEADSPDLCGDSLFPRLNPGARLIIKFYASNPLKKL
jgi:hypothetical protein